MALNVNGHHNGQSFAQIYTSCNLFIRLYIAVLITLVE